MSERARSREGEPKIGKRRRETRKEDQRPLIASGWRMIWVVEGDESGEVGEKEEEGRRKVVGGRREGGANEQAKGGKSGLKERSKRGIEEHTHTHTKEGEKRTRRQKENKTRQLLRNQSRSSIPKHTQSFLIAGVRRAPSQRQRLCSQWSASFTSMLDADRTRIFDSLHARRLQPSHPRPYRKQPIDDDYDDVVVNTNEVK